MLLRTISVETAEQTELNAALLCGFAIPASDRNFIAYSLNEQVDENDSRVYIASLFKTDDGFRLGPSRHRTRPARRPSRCSANWSAKPPPATAGPAIWPTTSSTCRTRPSPPRGGKNTAPGARTRMGDEARHLRVPHGYGPALDGEEPCAEVPPLVQGGPFRRRRSRCPRRRRCGRDHGRAGGAHRRARGGGRRNRHRGRMRRARAAAGCGNGSARGWGASRVRGESGAVRQGSGCRGHRRLRSTTPVIFARSLPTWRRCSTPRCTPPTPRAAPTFRLQTPPRNPPCPEPSPRRTRAGTGIGQGPQPVAAPPGAARTPGRRRGRGQRQRGAHPGRRRHSPTRG